MIFALILVVSPSLTHLIRDSDRIASTQWITLYQIAYMLYMLCNTKETLHYTKPISIITPSRLPRFESLPFVLMKHWSNSIICKVSTCMYTASCMPIQLGILADFVKCSIYNKSFRILYHSLRSSH